MTWTIERSDLAVARWKEGWSAAQIAKVLGDGVSRNAVIGRLHRLGLSARAAASEPRATRPRPAPKPKATYAAPSVSAKPPPEMKDDGPGLATLMTLTPHMCRWPIGDPGSEDLTFCGQKRRNDTSSYCEGHARRAYYPPSPKRTASELIRSARRYA